MQHERIQCGGYSLCLVRRNRARNMGTSMGKKEMIKRLIAWLDSFSVNNSILSDHGKRYPSRDTFIDEVELPYEPGENHEPH